MTKEQGERRADPVGRIVSRIAGFAGLGVLVVGDVMLDHYLNGDVSRISPEGPVPVVRVRAERHMAGGAGNVARNCLALGAAPTLVSAVGNDEPGRALATVLEREGVTAVLAQDAGRPTTIKTRVIAQNQQVVRVDRESDAPLGAEAEEELTRQLARHLPGKAVVVVSDYAKGVITARLMDRLRAMLGSLSPRPPLLIDPKPANGTILTGADLLTPNLKEAGEMSGLPTTDKAGVLRAGLAIFKKYRCRRLCVTMGAQGIALFDSPDRVFHIPTAARTVYDVTGAGDTVIAALAVGLAGGLTALEACVLANACAGVAVAQMGAVAVGADEALASLASGNAPMVETWFDARRDETPPLGEKEIRHDG